jgi:uncharacterized protein YkwD
MSGAGERGARQAALALVVTTLWGCGGAADPVPSAGDATGSTASAAPATATAAAGAGPAASPTTAPAPAPAPVAATFTDQLLVAVNSARASPRRCGTADYAAAAPLQWQPATVQAADVQARYLQQNNLFTHTGANGSSVGDRLTATGYVWSTVGENLAAGYDTVAAVVQGWLDSPGHCANLMNGRFTDLGVVKVDGTSSNTYRNYWAMVLARPR